MNGPITRGGVSVLLVEDEQAILRLATMVLERAGFLVLPAGDAAEALATVEQIHEPPAVVIADLVLPGSRGEDLARRLRERWPGLPVLFTSGDPTSGRDLPDGTTFLAKPFSPDDLVKAVRALLARSDSPRG